MDPTALEAAVLDRGRPRRAFKRLGAASLQRLLSEFGGAAGSMDEVGTPHPDPTTDTPAAPTDGNAAKEQS